jgi:transcriptional regulator with XRE-family HTH domain
MAQKQDYSLAPSESVEFALGRQLEKIRLGKNINQTQLAKEAGVSRRTITRLENGEGVSLDTFVRVLQALGIADRLDTLFPDLAARPVDRVRFGGRERKRARTKPKREAGLWTWGDKQDDS